MSGQNKMSIACQQVHVVQLCLLSAIITLYRPNDWQGTPDQMEYPVAGTTLSVMSPHQG